MISVIIGASAGLGRALAEELARAGHDLFLVSTDKRDLDAVAADLTIRYKTRVAYHAADITAVPAQTIRASCTSKVGKPDCLFLVSGQSDLDRDFEKLSEDEVQELAQVNFVSPVKIALAFLPDLMDSDSGNVVGIGSIAEARPRAKNTVYAASKLALEFFFGGLRAKLSSTQCRVQYYRVGYMATQMNFGRKGLLPSAAPIYVAKKIVVGLGHDRVGAYLPWWWRYVMRVYKALPWFIFKKLPV